MVKRLRPLACLLFYFACAAQSQEGVTQIPVIIAALRVLDANDIDENWLFTMQLVEDGEYRVIRSDPSRSKYEKRQLVTIDGEPPDDRKLREFRSAEKKRIKELDQGTQGYLYLVDIDTLTLTSQQGELSEFSFQPRIIALEKAQEKMHGTLLFNRASGNVEKIEIRNTSELSPAFSVTVDEYRLTFIFGADDGQRLLRKMESHAVGKAAFIKRFESLVEIDFSEYQRAGGGPPKAH